VRVEANIAGPQDVAAALACGADGVGLLRTEFLFLGSDAMPDEDEQAAAYTAVADELGGRPLTIRTLDAGADKPLPYLALPAEANPFLGVRGLRLGLARPEQLLRQLRAVLRAAAGRDVRVMFPMVADVDELRRAREILSEARASLRAQGAPVPDQLETGIMLEVPSAALLAETLAPLVDFFSIGTNDLTQYTLAAERGNPGVAGLFDPLHPAVLRLIERTAKAAAAAGRRVAVCGEVAGDRLAVPLLVGLGVTELSMNPASIPAAKEAMRATRAGLAAGLAREALAAESASGGCSPPRPLPRRPAAGYPPPRPETTKERSDMTGSPDDALHILALVGSLRRGSYNRMLWETAVEVAPGSMVFTEADVRSLPLYDDDVRLEQDYPEPARRLRAAVAAADGVLIVSPEYNHAVPGLLQNAIDWASRPPDQPFKDKPVAIMGASTGRMGTVRMQHGLRATLDSLEAHTLLKPEVMIGNARDCFDETCLVDDQAREVVGRLMTAFESWVRRFAAQDDAGPR
jgi:NAD(P)H-dependent FMN reductase